MSKSTITIDPVTRIEGHLGVNVEQEDGVVTEARCSGTLFRGLETILGGRDPRDAPILTQRICGVCPQAHATASARALDDAYGVTDQIPANGRLLRNIMLGANFLQSHVLHFYHLAALDYVDVTAAGDYDGNDPDLMSIKDFLARGHAEPFVPRYEGDYRLEDDENRAATKHYVQALEVRKNAHELLALFGGKMPHQCTVNVGGVGTEVTADKIMRALSYVESILEFVDNAYLPDILLLAERYPDYLKIGAGCSRFLAFGGVDSSGEPLFSSGVLTPENKLVPFERDKIREEITSSFYADESKSESPFDSTTVPETEKENAYSWLKSPRYDGKVCEVGPLARMMVGYADENEIIKNAVEGLLEKAGLQPVQLNSTLGRHAARALETRLMATSMKQWIMELQPGSPCILDLDVPKSGQGAGLTEAPRGALSHWATIEDGELKNYQCVVPTTWNGSPRDNRGVAGPMEQAIENETLKDLDNPFEVVRIIRSFDPCLACAVHLQRPKGELKVELPIT